MSTPVPTPTTTATPQPVQMTSTTTVAAGQPVQTYPSPQHAQWAAGQIQSSTPVQSTPISTPTPHSTTPAPTATASQTPALSTYYHHYSQYPAYYQQYLAQAVAQAQQNQSAGHAAQQQQQQQQQHATSVATPIRTTTIQAPTPSVAHVPTAPTPVAAASMPPPANALDTSDIATLNDALGSAGVDLRAEEESLQRHEHQPYQQTHSIYMQSRPYEDRSKKQPTKPAFDTRALGTTMRAIGTHNKVSKIPEDSVNYVALALRARLQDLITAMISASKYRKEAQYDRPPSFYEPRSGSAMDVDGTKMDTQTPMWSVIVRADVAKQLAVLERVEREEEMRIRRERKERLELQAALAAQVASGANMDPNFTGNGSGVTDELDGQPKKKKKKEGPGVTARNMSEDVRKKMSNAVATQAAGLGKYAWMTAAANAPSPSAKSKAAPAAASSPAATQSHSWARPYVPKKPVQAATTSTTPEAEGKSGGGEDSGKVVVTVRDAMFVIGKERGHGGGKGAARGWT